MDFGRARQILIESISPGIKDKRTLSAMSRVPRERFVPIELQSSAYDDRPLGIAFSQTISQPYMVALMTEAMELAGREKVLEIGTGSGYQAAILAELAGFVYSVERIPGLAGEARRLLAELGYNNVQVELAGDQLGCQKYAPYEAILVAAGAPAVPRTLIDQLAEGGRLVIPVGSRFEQELLRVTKGKTGNRTEKLGGCRFVPLIGRDAWQE
ncbi:MAG: protein-L-isoaspartate(D-aspartate) O-methyltransferase [Chloroflexi bacterium]|nr:protein-L-isoaspartate(D-aspartate) O-methyltransferase [Chloroflexota bacterium]